MNKIQRVLQGMGLDRTGLAIGYTLVLVICLSIVYIHPSWDGAMNLLQARDIATSGRYYSEYFERPFPSAIQSRFTLQLSAALFIKIFGFSNWSVLLTNAIGIFTFVLLLSRVLRRLSRYSQYHHFVFSLLVLFCYYYFSIGLTGYGEVIILVLSMLGVYLWYKSLHIETWDRKKLVYIILSGVLLFLACITKSVAFIFLASFLMTLGVKMLRDRKIGYDNLVWVFSFSMALLMFEIWRYHLSVDATFGLLWLEEYKSILRQAGLIEVKQWVSQFTEVPWLWRNMLITSLHAYTSLTVVVLFFGFSIIVILERLVYFAKRKLNEMYLCLFIFMFSALYLIWWFWISPSFKVETLGIRRILPVIVINIGIMSLAIQDFLVTIIKNKKVVSRVISVGGLIMSLVIYGAFVFPTSYGIKRFISWDLDSSIEQDPLIRALNDLPDDSKIYVHGYNHSPKILLYANKAVKDIQRIQLFDISDLRKSYFLFDKYAESRSLYIMLKDVFDMTDYYSSELGSIVKIEDVRTDLGTDAAVSCLLYDDIYSYPHKSGVYGNNNWMFPVSTFMLKREGQEQELYINYYLPETIVYGSDRSNIVITVNGTILLNVPIELGSRELFIPLEKLKTDDLEVNIRTTSIVANARELYGVTLIKVCLRE